MILTTRNACPVNVTNASAFFFAPQNPWDTLKYQQWQKVNDRMENVELVAAMGDAFSELKCQRRYFLIHTFIKEDRLRTY